MKELNKELLKEYSLLVRYNYKAVVKVRATSKEHAKQIAERDIGAVIKQLT